MDPEEMKRHLAGGPDTETGAGAPGREAGDPWLAVTTLSARLERLKLELEQLTERLEAAQAEAAQTREGLDGQTGKIAQLQQGVEALAEQFQALAETVAQAAPEDGPPQPFDWAAMSAAERQVALETLTMWARDELYGGWPHLQAAHDTQRPGTQRRVPACWFAHEEMVRAMGGVYTAYQQAFRHPSRRAHHESDFYRVLDDALRRIGEATVFYGCADNHVGGVDTGPRDDHTAWVNYDNARAAEREEAVQETYTLVMAKQSAKDQGNTTQVAQINKRLRALVKQWGIANADLDAEHQRRQP